MKRFGFIQLFFFCFFGCLVFVCSVYAGSPIKLSFEQRVVYQRAIEEVYWSHTIWPAENPQPKPPLQQVMSEKDIRSKVAEYLRKSDQLDSYRHHPITGEQLQAEMDRMAAESKDPQVLREVWAALGNHPDLIAECFARPVLAERLAEDLSDLGQRSGDERDLSELRLEAPVYSYRFPEIKGGAFFDFSAIQAASTAPSARSGHTAVWTGTVMIIWGGNIGTRAVRTGGRYNPSTNSWAATKKIGAPSPRARHTAVWTGTVMIIWGGNRSNTGGRYNPSTNSWLATTTTGAPSGRFGHTAVWTGTQMIIWGGGTDIEGSIFFNTGGRYNPSSNSWLATTTAGAPSARVFHTAVWTGTQMIIWGGCNGLGCFTNLKTGGRYNPSTNSWLATTPTGAPSGRTNHTAIWTGTQMIIWGGCMQGQGCQPPFNTGGRYNPSTNSWTATTTASAPTARLGHTAVWTGIRMIIWGGNNGGALLNTGGRYNPSTDSWAVTTQIGAPSSRAGHTAVWTGTQMIIWGGSSGTGLLNTGALYSLPGNTWAPTAQ